MARSQTRAITIDDRPRRRRKAGPPATAAGEHVDRSPRRYLTVDEAALYTGFPRFSVYRRVSENTIPHLKIGRRVMFDMRELDRWIQQFRVPVGKPKTEESPSE